jgi:hypothetical protein
MLGFGTVGQQDVDAGGEFFGICSVGDEQIVESRARVGNSPVPPRGGSPLFCAQARHQSARNVLEGRSSSGNQMVLS